MDYSSSSAMCEVLQRYRLQYNRRVHVYIASKSTRNVRMQSYGKTFPAKPERKFTGRSYGASHFILQHR